MIWALILLCIDQYCKYLSIHRIFPVHKFIFVQFTLEKNAGISLGFMADNSWIFIASLQILALLWVMTQPLPNLTKSLIYAGGISNLIDRVYYGFVIDYLKFQIGTWHWPAIVNLADIYLTAGIIIWLYLSRKNHSTK